jgi:hypothetical protein
MSGNMCRRFDIAKEDFMVFICFIGIFLLYFCQSMNECGIGGERRDKRGEMKRLVGGDGDGTM